MNSILVISEIFWPEGGGAELATYLILDILAKHNFDITVVTGTKSPAKIRGVKYYITPYLRALNRIVRWVNMGLLRRDERFEEILSRHNILYIPLAAYPLIPLAKRKGLKVVVHLHNYAPIRYSSIKYCFEPETSGVIKEFRYAVFHEFFIQKSVSRALLSPTSCILYLQSKKWISQADKVICVSRRQAEIIADQAPELRDKIEVVYNPLPPEIINAEPRKELDNTPTFLYVGGDSYVKGFHILLQALNKLGKQGAKARFILTNKYSPRSLKILKQLSDKYRNLEIRVLGKIEYSKLIELYRKAWALLFPSIWEEPLPYAIVEAMTLGTISIASRVGGVTELLNGTIAQQFTVIPGSVNDLAKRISMITSLTADEVKVSGFKLREEILRKLDPNKIERRIIEVFEEGH